MKSENLILNIPYFRGFWAQFSQETIEKEPLRPIQAIVEKEQILIIDGEWNMLKLLYSVLSPKYDITIKNSAIDGLKWLESGNHPSLILCEYELPFFSGTSFIQTLKSRGLNNTIPLIILSDAVGFEQDLTTLPYKIDGMIRKPFNPISLKSTIQTVINEYKSAVAC